jgi:hypothetical protein
METSHILSRDGIRLNGSAALVADAPVALAIKYVGSSVSATVTVVSATGITLKVGAVGAEAADTSVDTNGVVEFSTYTTLGAVADAINVSGNWKAEIVDGLRSDAVNGSQMLARSETTLAPAKTQVLSLFWDTSAHLAISYAISARRTNLNATQKGKTSVFKACNSLINTSSGETTLLRVYSVSRDRASSTLLFTQVGADNTDLASTVAAGQGDVRSAVGEDLLVRLSAANLPDSGAYLNVAGYVLP